MAEKKITELTRLSDIKDLDLLAGVNTKNDETVKMTAGDLRAFILAGDGTGEVVTSITEGTQSGTIAVNGEDVFVKDIKSAAFSDRTEFDVAGAADKALESANTYTDTEIQTVNTRVDGLETSLTERINQAEENTTQLETTLTEKITQTETSLNEKVNKIETDANTRIDQVETATKEYADQAEADAKSYSDEQLTATMAALKISDIPNDTGFVTETVNSLVNYYKKSETYTQAEINELITKINSFEILVVTELPTENINDHAIYFVRKAGEGNDFYEEYVYVNNTWEYVGNTIIDLSGKADVEDIEELQKQIDTVNSNLNTKANQSSLDTLQTQINNIEAEVAEKAAQSSLDALQSEVDNLEAEVAKKVAQSSLDTLQNEVDNLENVVDTKVAQEDFNSFQTQVNDTFNGNEAMGEIVVSDIECKNLLNIPTFNISYGNGIISFNGENLNITPTGSIEFIFNIISCKVDGNWAEHLTISPNMPIKAGTYTLSAKTNDYEHGRIYICWGEVGATFNNTSHTEVYLANGPVTFTVEQDSYLAIGVYHYGMYPNQIYSEMQLELGDKNTSYAPYKKFGYNSQESVGKIVVDDISCKNKFNYLTVIGGWIDTTNSIYEQYQDLYCYSDYIEVEPLTTYTLNLDNAEGLGSAGILAYGSSQTFLSNITAELTNIVTFTTPSNCYYIRFTCRQDSKDKVQLEKGNKATYYTPYQNFNGEDNKQDIEKLYSSFYGNDTVFIDSCDSFIKLYNYVYSRQHGKTYVGSVGSEDNTAIRTLLGNPNIGGYVVATFKPINEYQQPDSEMRRGVIEITAWNVLSYQVSKGWIICNPVTEDVFWTGWTYQLRNTTISTSEPSGGKDGDIWIKYTE